MFSRLKSEWVVGWHDIIREEYVGDSHGYTCEQTAVGTTNGAGGRNVQLFFLSPDGVVLHALPGFWHPTELALEMDFARELWDLWRDPQLDVAAKRAAFRERQLARAANSSPLTRARSAWQGFDAKNEAKRFEELGQRDTVLLDPAGQPLRDKKGRLQLKTLDVLVHERMAARPFLAFAEFDTAVFADYGRPYYDNNKKVDGEGEAFLTPRKLAKQEAKRVRREAKREARRAAKRARKLAKQRARRAKPAQEDAS